MSGEEVEASSLLAAVQNFVETELLPAMQSQANEVLRYSIGTPSHFLSASGTVWANDKDRPPHDVSSPRLATVVTEAPADSVVDGRDPAAPVCLAASSVASLFPPVAAYWTHLPAHRLHFGVIFDRVLRGFVSAAKEELRSLVGGVSSSMLAASASVKAAVMAALREDPLYVAYRHAIGSIHSFHFTHRMSC